MTNLIVPFMILIGSSSIANMMNYRAFTTLLNDSQQQQLFERYRRWRHNQIFGGLLALILLTVCSFIRPDLVLYFLSLVLMGVVIYYIVTTIWVYRDLKKSDYPTSYCQRYVASMSLKIAGLVIFIAMVASSGNLSL